MSYQSIKYEEQQKGKKNTKKGLSYEVPNNFLRVTGFYCIESIKLQTIFYWGEK